MQKSNRTAGFAVRNNAPSVRFYYVIEAALSLCIIGSGITAGALIARTVISHECVTIHARD